MAKQIPYIRTDESVRSWLKHHTKDGMLTPEEAERLCGWSSQIAVHFKCLEDERVFYVARAGDITEAIEAFGALLRSCQKAARQQNNKRKNMRGWCRECIVHRAAALMQSRVMSYLPEMIEVNDKDNLELLQQVITENGYQRFKK